ncbi:MAG: hypothetical protein D6725_04850 [Planctomycetota bacterium]|nr:MAG: hypothetical protein D6725_04850 [Planctomycetota bacterium]
MLRLRRAWPATRGWCVWRGVALGRHCRDLCATAALAADVSKWLCSELVGAVSGPERWRGVRPGPIEAVRRQGPWMVTAVLGIAGLFFLLWASSVPRSALPSQHPKVSLNQPMLPRLQGSPEEPSAEKPSSARDFGIPERSADDPANGPRNHAFESTRAPQTASAGTTGTSPAMRTARLGSEPGALPDVGSVIRPIEATEEPTPPQTLQEPATADMLADDAPPTDDGNEQPAIIDVTVKLTIGKTAQPPAIVVARSAAGAPWTPAEQVVMPRGDTIDGPWRISSRPAPTPSVVADDVGVVAAPARFVTRSRTLTKRMTSSPTHTVSEAQQVRVNVGRARTDPMIVGRVSRFHIRIRNAGPGRIERGRVEIDLPATLVHRHGRFLQKTLTALRPGTERTLSLTMMPVAPGSGRIVVRFYGEPALASRRVSQHRQAGNGAIATQARPRGESVHTPWASADGRDSLDFVRPVVNSPSDASLLAGERPPSGDDSAVPLALDVVFTRVGEPTRRPAARSTPEPQDRYQAAPETEKPPAAAATEFAPCPCGP